MERRSFIKVMTAAGVVSFMSNAFSVAEAKCPAGCNCPKCREQRRNANGSDDRINHLSDKSNPSMLEKKHVPLVSAPSKVKKGEWFEVGVKVGFEVEHPSTPGHFIEEITLIVNGHKVAKLENEQGGLTSPYGFFKIRLDSPSTIQAVAECNLHGKWISEPVDVGITQ